MNYSKVNFLHGYANRILAIDLGARAVTVPPLDSKTKECFQRGYLTTADTDGLELAWGNELDVLELIHRLAHGNGALACAAAKGMGNLVDWVVDCCKARTGTDPRHRLELFAMQTKGLPFSFYRTHRSLSMQASYAAASDIGAHHAAAWLIKVDLLGAFHTFEDKAKALIVYPRVRLGNDNMGVCKLPWVDVFNPESMKDKGPDMHINPASQELYAEFFNGMLGTELSWEEIFERTDRDINLQRVMNAMRYGRDTGKFDWVPDRAIGLTEDSLYEIEGNYNDQELCSACGKSPEEVQSMTTAEKRKLLMQNRKENLRRLIDNYYVERGWNNNGIPEVETLERLGL